MKEEKPDPEAQWAFIFNTIGQKQSRQMMMKAAMARENDERFVLEFREGKALDITEHVKELEK